MEIQIGNVVCAMNDGLDFTIAFDDCESYELSGFTVNSRSLLTDLQKACLLYLQNKIKTQINTKNYIVKIRILKNQQSENIWYYAKNDSNNHLLIDIRKFRLLSDFDKIMIIKSIVESAIKNEIIYKDVI